MIHPSARVAAAALLLLLSLPASRAHTGPGVIVDTDLAADDARALALILASPYVHVTAIVTSDGASPPDAAATNVCRILGFLKQTGVAVGVGRSLAAPPPAFRSNATDLDWERLGPPAMPPGGLRSAREVIRLALRSTPYGNLYICLGPLTNLADALEADPDLARAISLVLWYGTPPNAPRAEWNAQRDPAALKRVAAAGLRVEAMAWPETTSAPLVDAPLLDELALLHSPAADLIVRLHQSGRGAELVRARHLRLWDDLVAVRFLNPSLGAMNPVPEPAGWSQLSGVDPAALSRTLVATLRRLPARGTVIMAEFPDEPEHLLPDVAEIAPQIIARHGLEEWKAAVLTSELHRHLGTYSIIGAKMGLRAREWFNAALDELRVESHAGLKPPLSCLNDGLQVATGASLGRGTITVLTNGPPACEAVFRYGDAQLRLRLKPEFARQIASDIVELEKRHGGPTPEYFQAVRAASLQHWLNFDRTTLFEGVSP